MKLQDKLRIAHWMKIGSAPRDGTRVDLWYSTAGIGYRPNAYWDQEHKWWVWDSDEPEGGIESMPNVRPTHWIKPLAVGQSEQK